MNKMAFFVEGYTEVLYIEKLILEIANRNTVRIEQREIYGGTTCARQNMIIRAAGRHVGQEHFVVIYNCRGDNLVKSRMMEEYDLLTKSNYSKIVCVRDVFPEFAHGEISKLEAGLPYGVRTKPIVVDFILSIMEIEALFLAEHTHFQNISAKITIPAIIATCRFDPINDDMQLRPMPADDLNNCYAIGGMTYEKKNVQVTVEAIDFAHTYVDLVKKYPYLNKLCDIITTFLNS